MADFLADTSPGDSVNLDAREWNAYKAAARAHITEKAILRGGHPRDPTRAFIPAWIKNDCGSDLTDRYQILGIDTTVAIDPTSYLDTFKQGPILVGKTPAIADHFGRWAVTLQPIVNGALGLCAIAGIVAVQVEIDDADHEFCDVRDTDRAKLESKHHGAGRILFKDGVSGTQWCAVRIGHVTYRFDRCTCLMKGTTGSGSKANCTGDNVKIIAGASPLTAPTSLTEELTVYNKHGYDFDDNGAADVEWNKTQERWEIYQMDCQV